MNKIDRLTAEQEALIPVYRKKWQDIAFSTKPIDKEKIYAAIKQVYNLLDKPEPVIIFSVYPNSKEEILFSHGLNSFGLNLNYSFAKVITQDISQQINNKLTKNLASSIRYQLEITNIWNLLSSALEFADTIIPDRSIEIAKYTPQDSIVLNREDFSLIERGMFLDFCSEILDLDINIKNWQLLLNIICNSTEILAYENICIVYDRFINSIFVDEENNLHCSTGKPAIKFTNGLEVYAVRGQVIPPKYGSISTEKWKSEWLLEETGIHTKELAIKIIGKARIYKELQTTDKINQAGVLTPKQKQLLVEYRDKWQKIACSTAKEEEKIATKYIKQAYQYLNLQEPEVLFFDSPYLAQEYAIVYKLKAHLRKTMENNIFESVKYQILNSEIENHKIDAVLFKNIKYKLSDQNEIWLTWVYSNLFSSIRNKVKQEFKQFIKCIRTEKYIVDASLVDFLLSVLNYYHEQELLEIFVGLVKHCGWDWSLDPIIS